MTKQNTEKNQDSKNSDKIMYKESGLRIPPPIKNSDSDNSKDKSNKNK